MRKILCLVSFVFVLALNKTSGQIWRGESGLIPSTHSEPIIRSGKVTLAKSFSNYPASLLVTSAMLNVISPHSGPPDMRFSTTSSPYLGRITAGDWTSTYCEIQMHRINQSEVSGGLLDFVLVEPSGFRRSAMIMYPNGIIDIGRSEPYLESLQPPPPSIFNESGQRYRLYVRGGILTQEVKVKLSQGTWGDYVFKSGYSLLSLKETEQYIIENKRLPGFNSADDYESNGLELKHITLLQQEKIEELYLHIIELSNQVEELKARLDSSLEIESK